MTKQAVIVFAHGARDPAWAGPLHRVCDALRQRRPEVRVELAFLELMSPSIGEALDRLAEGGFRKITVMPAFMAEGGHLKRDLPLLIDGARQRHPGMSISVVPAMGLSEQVIAAIADYAAAAADHAAG